MYDLFTITITIRCATMASAGLEGIDFKFDFAHAVTDGYFGVDLVDKAFLAVDEPPLFPVVRDVGYLGYGGEAANAVFLAVEKEVDKLCHERIDVTARPDTNMLRFKLILDA